MAKRLAGLPDRDETANVVPMAADEEKNDGDGAVEQQKASGEGDVGEPEKDAKGNDAPSEANADEESSGAEAEEGASEAGPSEDEAEAEASDVGEAQAAEKAPAAVVHPPGAAWANGLVRVERALTWFESRLLFVALLCLVLGLVFWISLRGMASPVESGSAAGTVFRMFVGAGLLGAIARVSASRVLKLDEVKSAGLTILGVAIGIAVAPMWRAVGIARFDAILNWLQEGSSLTLVGGLRGVATRLTIIVALLGASLAAARSKHINIDVVLRFMRPSWRMPVHVVGAAATAAVCFIAAYGFLDYTSIEGFGQNKDTTMSAKIDGIRRLSAQHRFVFYKQIGLDLRTMPDVVFSGVRWDAPTRMNGKQWNAWLAESGYSEHFTPEEIESMKAPAAFENEPRVPMATLPGEGAKNALVHDLNLIWPLGLLWIGLRVILRALLVISGHASVEPDADEPDEDEQPTADRVVATEAAR